MTRSTARQGWVRARLERFVRFNADICNPAWGGIALVTRFRPLLIEGILRLATFIFKEATAGPGRMGEARILVAVGSRNNLASAIEALGHRDDISLLAFHNLKVPEAGRIGLLAQYLTGLWVLPLLPVFLWQEDRPHVRRAMLARLDAFVLTMGNGKRLRRAFARSGARMVAVMSQLSCYHCLIVEQARRAGLTTVFLTHAPIGRGQLPLEVDYALLDGAYQRQLFPQSATRIRVTGSARGRKLSAHFRDRSQETGVVIATNTLIRDLTEIERLIEALRQDHAALPVAIRPHPADRVRFDAHRQLATRVGARYHDPALPLHEGLDDCKFVISTQSGVILDALLLGFYPLIVSTPEVDRLLDRLPDDYYGFAELDIARQLDLARPELPLDWNARRNLEHLERAGDADWDVRGAIDDAIDDILEVGWDVDREG